MKFISFGSSNFWTVMATYQNAVENILQGGGRSKHVLIMFCSNRDSMFVYILI